MKKIVVVLTAVILAFSGLTACSSNRMTDSSIAVAGSGKQDGSQPQKMKIVTTIFPEYDWVKAILGDDVENADLTMLLGDGVDLHSYQPTVDDIMKISTCDLFLYVGGASDAWVEDALKEAANKNMVTVNLMEVMGNAVKEEKIVEGMQAEAETDKADEGGGKTEYDEHVWLSLKNAGILCRAIAEALEKAAPEKAAVYKENAAGYIKQLAALDEEYQKTVDDAQQKTLVFGDRFPFRYLADDYGLTYYAAFVGCSAETEASFKTIKFLADKIDELGLPRILTIDGSDKKIAQTISENTKGKNQEILTLDSMQSTTSEDVASGVTYLTIMKSNLEVLKEALN